MLGLREMLLVETCLLTLLETYEMEKAQEIITAPTQWKLNFLSFLNENTPEEVSFGIEFLYKSELPRT